MLRTASEGYPSENKKIMVSLPKKGQNITITILGKYSIDNSSSPDSHLNRSNILPSQVAPMTGFRQRIWISMPTVLVKCGDLDKILTPFPYVAPKPDDSVFTANGPLFDFSSIL